jgi:hypothetical protein
MVEKGDNVHTPSKAKYSNKLRTLHKTHEGQIYRSL